MNKNYYIQINDYMEPAKVKLTENEVDTIIYVLKEIVKSDEDSLVCISDEDGMDLYTNYNEWIKTHRN